VAYVVEAAGAAGIRRLLMNERDPIGVRGVPAAADEYDSVNWYAHEMARSD
jgi:hypothetical protein